MISSTVDPIEISKTASNPNQAKTSQERTPSHFLFQIILTRNIVLDGKQIKTVMQRHVFIVNQIVKFYKVEEMNVKCWRLVSVSLSQCFSKI